MTGKKLVVLVVGGRRVGASLNGHTGRTRNRVRRGAVDLNAQRKCGAGAGIALVNNVYFVGRFLEYDRPVGPAGAAHLAVRRKHHPVLAVGRRTKGLVDDEIVGSDRSQAPNAHRIVGNARVGQGRLGVARRRGRGDVERQNARGRHLVLGNRAAVEVETKRQGLGRRPRRRGGRSR